MRTWSLRLLRQLFRLALSALHMLATAASPAFKSRATLHLENLALRHQLSVLRRSVKRPKLTSADRLLWAWLCEVWIASRSSAPQRLPAVLDMESSSRPTRAPSGVETDSPTDSQDEPRESALGRAAHPRRIAQARHRYRRDQRGQVHRAQSEPAAANVSDLPGESRQEHARARPLPSANDPASRPLPRPGSGRRPKADRA